MNCFSRIANCTTSPPSRRDKWPSTEQYAGHLQLIGQILVEGRQAGEFERKTPLDEATLAVYMVMCPFINPVQLQSRHRAHRGGAACLLILRSLSPLIGDY